MIHKRELAARLLHDAILSGEIEPSGYPEHDKLSVVKDQSQAIGEFLDYSGYTLCVLDPNLDELLPVQGSIQSILAGWFGIDEQKLNDEKKTMLAVLREAK